MDHGGIVISDKQSRIECLPRNGSGRIRIVPVVGGRADFIAWTVRGCEPGVAGVVQSAADAAFGVVVADGAGDRKAATHRCRVGAGREREAYPWLKTVAIYSTDTADAVASRAGTVERVSARQSAGRGIGQRRIHRRNISMRVGSRNLQVVPQA